MDTNSFLANVHHEETRDEQNEEKEEQTSPDSPPESKTEDETDSQPEENEKENEDESFSKKSEKEPPVFHAFHEHPRWKAREQELKELRSQNEELLEFRGRVEPLLEKFKNTPETTQQQIPQWFQNLYGDDADSWKSYLQNSKSEREEIKKEILESLGPIIETAKSTKEQKELDTWASNQWKELSSDPEVLAELKTMNLQMDSKIQGEISEIISKYLPTDEETGNISLRKGYEIWKMTHLHSHVSVIPKQNVLEKKKIGALKKTTESSEEKDFRTSEDFKGKSIADLVG